MHFTSWFIEQRSTKKMSILKIVVGGVSLIGLGIGQFLWDLRPQKIHAVDDVEFERYMGTWFEIARKPIYIEKRSYQNIKFTYSDLHQDKFDVRIDYQRSQGRFGCIYGRAKRLNAPHYNQFNVSSYPSIFRYLQLEHYYILKLDEAYQIALVGNAKRTHLWLLAREKKLERHQLLNYLNDAQDLGFNIDDLIYSQAPKGKDVI